jgi:uncharacterized membrane protein
VAGPTPGGPDDPGAAPPGPADLGVVERNIRALLDRRRHAQARRGIGDRVADGVTAFAGSMPFVSLHLLLVGGWVAVNLRWTPLPPFDPTFVVLAMVASVEAIFLSTFILISQNRMQAEADRRADLDLQVSLLAEHELTRLIRLVSAVAERLHVDPGADPELPPLAQDVRPEQVLERIERTEEDFRAAS